MGETLKATVQTRKVKSGTQALILVPTKKGQREQVLRLGIVSQDLAQVLNSDPTKLAGTEVEYLLEGGQVQEVRRTGQPWDPSSVPAQKTQGPKYPAKTGVQAGSSFHGAAKGHQGVKAKHQQAYGQKQSSPSQAYAGHLFENPYNFISSPPRPESTTDLRDHAPLGHHRYHQDHWSGRIEVKLTTVTPLLIPDAATVTDTDGHKTFDLRLDPDGIPYLPPTSIKGMLRTAYEAITNSRMGIFASHDDPLAIRQAAQSGAQVVPARVSDDSTTLELLPGTTEIGPNGEPVGRPSLMYAAWIPMYGSVRGLLKRNRNLAQHRQAVWVEIEHWEHWVCKKRSTQWSNNFDCWRVVAVEPAGTTAPTTISPVSRTSRRHEGDANRHQPHSEPKASVPHRWVRGWVFVSQRNIDRKHDERIFFVNPQHIQQLKLPISITDEMRRQWRVLITNYQDEHKKEISQEITRPPALRDYCVWSRHIVADKTERDLSPGTLCYARVEAQAGGNFEVLALYPVMISRDLYKVAPAKLMPSEVRSAPDINKLSPADRVFGWVKGDGPGAFRGQLRVGPVTCEAGAEAIQRLDNGEHEGLALAILGQPKPQQARFYAAGDRNGTPLADGSAKGLGYSNLAQGLRGRKFYPHQRQGESPDYWSLETAPQQPLSKRLNGREIYQEFRRLPDPANDNRTRDNQNRSIRTWVKPETTFRFDLQVTNLSAVELGALLWLLSLPERHYLRLGLGKPLGFGSVRLEIDSLDLRDGDAFAEDYRRLINRGERNGRLRHYTKDCLGNLLATYKEAVTTTYKGSKFENVPFIHAFLHACCGGIQPVHYPRTTERSDPSGKTYEWFVSNERGGNGPRYALPSLEESDRGLPYLTQE